jgi:hypothetical protein
MASYVELFIDQGTTFNNIINLTDDTTNTPINIYGYSVSSQIRRSYYSANITANITCSLTNTSNGEITMSMTAANTSNIKPGRYVFDVKTTDTYNVISRVLEGIITVNPSVTR